MIYSGDDVLPILIQVTMWQFHEISLANHRKGKGKDVFYDFKHENWKKKTSTRSSRLESSMPTIDT